MAITRSHFLGRFQTKAQRNAGWRDDSGGQYVIITIITIRGAEVFALIMETKGKGLHCDSTIPGVLLHHVWFLTGSL